MEYTLNSMYGLEGEVAVITGAGSGMGRASALLFAREGAMIVAADLNEETGQETGQATGKRRSDRPKRKTYPKDITRA